MVKKDKKSFELEITKGIGYDFFKLYNEDLEDPIADLPIITVYKSFKVKNYNSNISNDILSNLEIEIIGEDLEKDNNFSKNISHYF